MSFRQQFVTALYRFGSYYELIKVKGWRTILYTLALAICTVVILLARAVPGYIGIGGFSGMANKLLPEFSITDGTLNMDNYSYTDKNSSLKILVDTSEETADPSQAGDSIMAFIAGSKECYIFNGTQGSKLTFADLGMDFSKEDIVKNLAQPDVKYGLIAGIALVMFISCIMLSIYNIAVLALLGNIINMLIVRTPISFSEMLKLASYARTLPLVFSLVILVFVGFGVNTLVFYAVGVFYIYQALKNIKLNQDKLVDEPVPENDEPTLE
jgi:hypothetical protein